MINITGDPETSSEAFVDTFDDMKQALEDTAGDYKNITAVYCTGDIAQPAAGIRVPLSKPEVIVDLAGFIYTTAEDSAYNTIGTADPGTSAQAMHITMRNGTIAGNNWYGALGVYPEGNNYKNVTMTYEKVVYNGDQPCYNRYGLVEFIDVTANITYNEIAECNRIRLGGITTITHDAPIVPILMFINAATQFFEVTADADVKIYVKQAYGLINNLAGCRFTVEEGASLYIETLSGISATTSRFTPFELRAGARFTTLQTGNSVGLYVGNVMTVEEGAAFHMKKTTGTAVQLNLSSTALAVTRPELFLLESAALTSVAFTGTNILTLTGGQVNLWTAASRGGGFDDIPAFSWHKPQPALAGGAQEPVRITGNATATAFTVTDTNLTAEEQAAAPLSNLRLTNAFAFSIGQLPLWVNPIAEDGYPVFGVTKPLADLQIRYTSGSEEVLLTGASDGTGNFSVATPEPIPINTPVTITANRPFLLSTCAREVVVTGEIVVIGPPDRIVFDLRTRVSVQPALFARMDDDWTLQVDDTRARSTPWRLYAAIDRHLTSYDEKGVARHTLPGALVYVDTEDALHPLSGTPTLIRSGEANGGANRTWDVSWDYDRGLLLTISENPFRNREVYTADITWSFETD